jgi:hypothetical protein
MTQKNESPSRRQKNPHSEIRNNEQPELVSRSALRTSSGEWFSMRLTLL